MEGDALVVPLDVHTLPPVCVLCGAPSDGRPLEKVHHWHHPAWFVALPLGLIPYWIVSMIVTKKHRLTMSICAAHRRTRLMRMLAGFVGVPLVLFGLCTVSIAVAGRNGGATVPMVMLLCVLIGGAGLLEASRADKLIRPTVIGREEVRYRGASPKLLDAGVASVAEVFD